jgi:hypothetical protein
MLKAPGTSHLKLKYVRLLSNVAFNRTLRRYSVARRTSNRHTGAASTHRADGFLRPQAQVELQRGGFVDGRAVQVGSMKPMLKAPMVSALETINS